MKEVAQILHSLGKKKHGTHTWYEELECDQEIFLLIINVAKSCAA